MKLSSFIISIILAILLPALIGIGIIKISIPTKTNKHNIYKITTPTSIFKEVKEVINFKGNNSTITNYFHKLTIYQQAIATFILNSLHINPLQLKD